MSSKLAGDLNAESCFKREHYVVSVRLLTTLIIFLKRKSFQERLIGTDFNLSKSEVGVLFSLKLQSNPLGHFAVYLDLSLSSIEGLVINRALNCFSKALKFVHYLWPFFMLLTIVKVICLVPRALVYCSVYILSVICTGTVALTGSLPASQHVFFILHWLAHPKNAEQTSAKHGWIASCLR